jgi:hypothetical protein
MSLGRLLTMGKALTTLRDFPTSYRVRREALLPNFGGGNPFAPDGKAKSVAAETKDDAQPAVVARARAAVWPLTWLSGKKSLGIGAARRLAPGAMFSSNAPRPPAQGELSLDNVKVVRNDLRDSDVDVVARAGGTATARAAGASPLLLGAVAAEKALDRLADRIVGIESR